MTFIASVVAKDGVAIIADSLVTTSSYVIDFKEFKDYLGKKNIDGDQEILVDVDEVTSLFRLKPSHTKNYEDKLFRYDTFTAITTAGNAQINGMHIREIVERKNNLNAQNDGFLDMSLEEKIEDFCQYLTGIIREHLTRFPAIDTTIFLFTNYDPEKGETTIYKVETTQASTKDSENEDFVFVPFSGSPETFSVVSEGQNRICERILFGNLSDIYTFVPKIIRKFIKDFKLQIENNEEYIEETMSFLVTNEVMESVNIARLSQLSLQQAVDLAHLLMKIEIAFQKYTKNIPTVGGVIKTAYIDKTGFHFLSGNEIKLDFV